MMWGPCETNAAAPVEETVARDEEDVPVEKAAARDEDAGVEDAGEQTAAGAAA